MKNINPHKFLDHCIKKKYNLKNKNIKIFVEKNYDKFHSKLFTWQ